VQHCLYVSRTGSGTWKSPELVSAWPQLWTLPPVTAWNMDNFFENGYLEIRDVINTVSDLTERIAQWWADGWWLQTLCGKGYFQGRNCRWSMLWVWCSLWPLVCTISTSGASVFYRRRWTKMNINYIICQQIANPISVLQSGQKAQTHKLLKYFYAKRIQDSCPGKSPCFAPPYNLVYFIRN